MPAVDVAAAPPPDAVLLGAVDGVDTGRCAARCPPARTLREIGALLADTDAGLLTTATAVLGWHAVSPVLRAVRPGVARRDGRLVAGLPGRPRGVPAHRPRGDRAGARRGRSMVLARQPIWPRGRMSVLAGFVEAGESLEATVVREMLRGDRACTCATSAYLGSQPWPFPRSLMVGFAARADAGAAVVPAGR